MRTLTANQYLDSKAARGLAGMQLDESSFDVLIQSEDTTVLKPDGSILLILKVGVLSGKVCREAYPHLRRAVRKTDNRGVAAGSVPESQKRIHTEGDVRLIGRRVGRMRVVPIKLDGTISKTDYGGKNVESGLMGFYDRSTRFPYCRETAFNSKEFDSYRETLPFVQSISRVFESACPERFANQSAMCARTHPDFMIPKTVFTTVTVNRNWPTAVHQDQGDLKEGFGVMSVIRAGRFDGCYFVFPAYRVAVNMQTSDVLLADVHEWHGNTPIVGIRNTYERISTVSYYREHMLHCLSAKEELERVKRRKAGERLNG